ncbi:MAG TPA: hypothetical protein VII23_18675 [Terriglobales bacterium]
MNRRYLLKGSTMQASKFSAWIALVSMVLVSAGDAQTAAPAKASGATKTTSPKQSVASLDAQAQKYQQLLNDVDVTSDPDVKNAVYAKWVDVTCKRKQLELQQSALDASLAASIYQSCSKRLIANPAAAVAADAHQTANAAGGNQGPPPFPAGVEPPPGCSTEITIHFDTARPSDYRTVPQVNNNKTIDLAKMVRLNSNETGGEIYTRSQVYVGFTNRLRYTASLGSKVSAIQAPDVPFSQMFTTTPLTPAAAKSPPAGKPGAAAKPNLPPPAAFRAFSDCYTKIEDTFVRFQGALGQEEDVLSGSKGKISALINSLQPFEYTLDNARDNARSHFEIFPSSQIPPFPKEDLQILKVLATRFIAQSDKLKAWATDKSQDPSITSDYKTFSDGANNISARLDQYLGTAGSAGNASNSGNASDNASNPANASNSSNAESSGGAAASLNGSSQKGGSKDATNSAGSTPSTEANDYGSLKDYVENWVTQFKLVAGMSPDDFVVLPDGKLACGGFFGNGTSTLMQLSISDSLNPPATGTKVTPTSLDSVVCQPTISISNGLGLSFIPSQTPAFVAGVKKDAQGNPVLDSSGNPTIIQTLGYSNQSHVSAGYALQTNASLWATQQWGSEIHWSVGAMLTASSSGATTDIVTGPSFSFRRRTFFVSPMYDLGLRTQYVSPFRPGMPQGNLTSPPTQQIWKSGFGVTITFPFSTSTKNSSSSNGGATATTPGDGTGNGGGGNGGGTTPSKSKKPASGDN